MFTNIRSHVKINMKFEFTDEGDYDERFKSTRSLNI